MELAKPMRSLPAMGCPPMKCSSSPVACTASWMPVFTLPTSVRRQSGFMTAFTAARLSLFPRTGAHRKIISQSEKLSSMASVAASATPCSLASFKVDWLVSQTMILLSGTDSFRALAMEPPISPESDKTACQAGHIFTSFLKCRVFIWIHYKCKNPDIFMDVMQSIRTYSINNNITGSYENQLKVPGRRKTQGKSSAFCPNRYAV